ncbi:Clp amino terminal domain-containing protein, pathogenicity island component [Actinoplanes regularis]|uniref:Clp amino terminal domain-containing protein, pathogenicity island component n=1 Tax=Actinoplanes regularis TaxID=52697 RepID=A0A239DJB6_9ACTN|nr:Clp protease [Actinoplanes regularis]SNS32526.1 Clp amino terminal domain-containing protein, pathogenicity island component [Actinoplanes regularis]
MFERFTQSARAVVVASREEARELGHSVIGTEHLLLALLARESGAAAALRESGVDRELVRDAVVRLVGTDADEPGADTDRDAEDAAALKAIGIDLDAVRAAIEENFGAGSLRLPRPAPKKRGIFGKFYGSARVTDGHLPFSKRNKKVLELSLREALRLKHKFIAPEHIMLGVIREGEGLAMRILAEHGVDFEHLRTELTRSLEARAVG